MDLWPGLVTVACEDPAPGRAVEPEGGSASRTRRWSLGLFHQHPGPVQQPAQGRRFSVLVEAAGVGVGRVGVQIPDTPHDPAHVLDLVVRQLRPWPLLGHGQSTHGFTRSQSEGPTQKPSSRRVFLRPSPESSSSRKPRRVSRTACGRHPIASASLAVRARERPCQPCSVWYVSMWTTRWPGPPRPGH